MIKTDTLKKRRADILALVALVAISLYLIRPLLDWSQTTWGDITMSAAWLSWLKESLFTFHQFPTWSPLWMGGMPFFGMVPPGAFYMMMPFYLLTGFTATAYNLAIIVMFTMSGLSMYLYLRHLSGKPLPSFLGATIYVIFPVHISSMLFWGLFEILCAYAVLPLVLLFTDLLLERKAGKYLFLTAACLTFVMLTQIEFAFLFLLLYIPYLIFSLFAKGVGWRRILLIARTNKAWVIITLLLLLIPLWFYISVISQYGYFKGLQPYEIESGLRFYTYKHFGDAFFAKADDFLATWMRPATEHYFGPISFVVLLTSMLFAWMERSTQRGAQLLFFLIMGMAFLILSLGIYGPLFPLLREVIPVLKDMRVTLRFSYCFALCLPILFVLSFMTFSQLRFRIPKIPIRANRVLRTLLPTLLVIALLFDFSPYFDFYHHRLIDRQEYDRQHSFLRETLVQDKHPRSSIAQLLAYPFFGYQAEYLIVSEGTDGRPSSARLTTTSLPWNQTEEVVDYCLAVAERIVADESRLQFYSHLLAIDYIAVYISKVPPGDVMSTDYQKQKIARLDALSEGINRPLTFKGMLDTDYYTIYLYSIEDSPQAARFHPATTSLIVLSDDLFVSDALFSTYTELADLITARSFLNEVVAISTNVVDTPVSPLTVRSIEEIASIMAERTETKEAAAQIENLRVTSKGISIDVNAANEGFLSLAYYYNPWWKVYVDGKPTPVLRINGVFVGAYLAAGHHHVEFICDYPSLPNVISRLWR